MGGTLYVVATPIGNLEDLAPRARQTLESVDLIAAEDTRHTGRLLSHFGVRTPLFALHDHNEQQVVARLIADLESGKNIALVSDAGTPLVSDPGYRLVRAAHDAGVTVSPVPGASSILAALSVAGLPTDRFSFEGFLPPKPKARRAALAVLARETRTMIFLEAVHRIAASLGDMAAAFGRDRPAFIGRELTKLHEQCVLATLDDLGRAVACGDIVGKGEFVIVVAGLPVAAESNVDIDRLLEELRGHLPDRDIARIVASATGAKRNDLYQRLLALAKSTGRN